MFADEPACSVRSTGAGAQSQSGQHHGQEEWRQQRERAQSQSQSGQRQSAGGYDLQPGNRCGSPRTHQASGTRLPTRPPPGDCKCSQEARCGSRQVKRRLVAGQGRVGDQQQGGRAGPNADRSGRRQSRDDPRRSTRRRRKQARPRDSARLARQGLQFSRLQCSNARAVIGKHRRDAAIPTWVPVNASA